MPIVQWHAQTSGASLSSGETATAKLDDQDCKGTISQNILRKYVAHARVACRPRLQRIDQDKISRLYADLRRESSTCGGMPIAVRHLESLMRMAEAQVNL